MDRLSIKCFAKLISQYQNLAMIDCWQRNQKASQLVIANNQKFSWLCIRDGLSLAIGENKVIGLSWRFLWKI